MISLHERMLLTSAGVEPATSWSPVGRAFNWATRASCIQLDNCLLFRNTDQHISIEDNNVKQGSLKDSYIPRRRMTMKRPQNLGSNWWPLIVTLTLRLHCWVMGSAHHPTKANIWPKFNNYLSKGSGGMEWIWNSRLKLVTFNCDLDLESACLSYGFCTSPH